MGGKKLCYCAFTSFETLEQIVAKLSGHCDYYIVGGQEICPKTGSLHYHGLAYSEEAKCWKSITNPWNMCNKDDEFRKGPLAWVRYCCKLESKVDPEKTLAAESGLKPPKLSIIEKKSQATKSGNDRQRLKTEDILEKGLVPLIQEDKLSILRYDSYKKSVDKYLLDTTKLVDASSVKGIWIYGDPGVGKSFSVRQKYKDIYLKPQNKWWDGYRGESIILLDDFDCKVLGHYLKIWADCYGFNGEIKGGTIPLCYDKFIITSNYTPYDLFKDDTAECVLVKAIERRFKLIKKETLEHDISNLI